MANFTFKLFHYSCLLPVSTASISEYAVDFVRSVVLSSISYKIYTNNVFIVYVLMTCYVAMHPNYAQFYQV